MQNETLTHGAQINVPQENRYLNSAETGSRSVLLKGKGIGARSATGLTVRLRHSRKPPICMACDNVKRANELLGIVIQKILRAPAISL